jgi:hypothetical protein
MTIIVVLLFLSAVRYTSYTNIYLPPPPPIEAKNRKAGTRNYAEAFKVTEIPRYKNGLLTVKTFPETFLLVMTGSVCLVK